jgi:hypothetical protein
LGMAGVNENGNVILNYIGIAVQHPFLGVKIQIIRQLHFTLSIDYIVIVG